MKCKSTNDDFLLANDVFLLTFSNRLVSTRLLLGGIIKPCEIKKAKASVILFSILAMQNNHPNKC